MLYGLWRRFDNVLGGSNRHLAEFCFHLIIVIIFLMVDIIFFI